MKAKLTLTAVILVVEIVANWIYRCSLGQLRSFYEGLFYQVRYRSRLFVSYIGSNVNNLKNQEIMKKILYAIDGRFGKKVLKDQYRSWWRLMTYGTLVILFIRFVLFPFFQWWDGVVSFLNYVIWG